MHSEKLTNLSQAGLYIAIQDIKDELFDTPECDYAIAQLLNRWGLADKAEQVLDEMLMKWGSSPDMINLTQRGYAEFGNGLELCSENNELIRQPKKTSASLEVVAA